MFIKWLNTRLNMNKFMLIKKIVDTFGQPHFPKVYPKSKWDSRVGYFKHFVNFAYCDTQLHCNSTWLNSFNDIMMNSIFESAVWSLFGSQDL